MKIATIALALSVASKQSTVHSYACIATSSTSGRRLGRIPTSSAAAFSRARRPHRTACSLAATSSAETETEQPTSGTTFWKARQDCWRPDVRDVEKISWGKPASKKGKKTGSRGVPHRLNEEERRAFDQARRQGFLQVTGSSWRSQRRDAPLLNSYRSLMDARGRPSIVLHKLSPNSSGGVDHGDRLVVDLSPLRLPSDFERVESELAKRMESEFSVVSDTMEPEDEQSDGSMSIEESALVDEETAVSDESDYETRPIYQLQPHFVCWNVSRQQGKAIGKYLGQLFDNVEEKAMKSRKPKGVKPGRGRRHGGYGIG
ncbi:hypothetical protein ACHAXT_010385 [Thalassiosira profunda]